MGTFTAQFLVGSGHPYEGGIIPGAQIFISENSRPSLIMTELSYEFLPAAKIQKERIWIPSVSEVIDDVFLMISIYCLESEDVQELKELKEEFLKEILAANNSLERVEIYQCFSGERRTQLYKKNRRILNEHFSGIKVVATIMANSMVLPVLKAFDNYRVSLEVCLSVFKSHSVGWGKRASTMGDLDKCYRCRQGRPKEDW